MTVSAVSQKELNCPPSSISSKHSEAKYKQLGGIIPPPPGFHPGGASSGGNDGCTPQSHHHRNSTMMTSGSCCTGFVPTATGLKKSAQSFSSHSQLKSQMAEVPLISNNSFSTSHHLQNNYINHKHNSKHNGGGDMMMTHVMASQHSNPYLHHHYHTGSGSSVVHPGNGQQVHCHPPLPYTILQQQQSQHQHCTTCQKNGGELKNSLLSFFNSMLGFPTVA